MVTYTAVDNSTIGSTADGNWDTIVTTLVTDMSDLFLNQDTFNQDISSWDTSSVTTMEDMFRGASAFNQDLSYWDVSNVLNMQQTFYGAVAFNNGGSDLISTWVVSSVTDMDGMFRNATSFNRPIGAWNVGSVTSMSNMLRDASAFNQPLNSWDVSNVKYMQYLFRGASAFNQPLNSWDVSSALKMLQMFFNASVFNQNLNSWIVSNVTDMSQMFQGATNFNGNISSWVTSSLNIMFGMFSGANNFNQPLNSWNVSNVTSLNFTFAARAFNQDLSGWDTSSVKKMQGTFKDALVFNQDLSDWDTSSVENMADMFNGARAFNNNGSALDGTSWDVSNVIYMHEMFNDARVFNIDISGWVTTSLEDMSGMFKDALTFNQPLNSWTVSNVTNLNNTFNNADSFNQPLNSWTVSSVIYLGGTFKDNNSFNQDLSNWDTSSVINMRETFQNTVFNNGLASGVSYTLQWDTSSVTRMDNMFEGANDFNGNISGWNVSNVTRMNRMFFNASVFNQDLSNWNTSSATSLQGMFNGATIFNNGLAAADSSTIMNWNTLNVITIESTFASAPAFNGNISGWDVSNVTNANNLFNGASKFNHPLGGWDVTSITTMNNMFAAATDFDQDLNCWCVVHNPSRSSFSASSPINSKPLFLPRWAEPCDPSISFALSTIEQDDGLITPTIVSSGGTFTASITGGLVHRNNQWGSGKADFLDIDPNTGVINPSNSLAGVYDITYSTGACKSFTTSITVRSVNNPAYQLSYASSPICKSAGGTITPTIIPTNSHRTLPFINLDPGNPVSWTNVGSVTGGTTGILSNLTTNSSFTHWELKDDGNPNVWTDNATYHPNFVTRNNNGNIKHNEGMSLEFTAPGNLEDLIENDYSGEKGFFPRKSQSVSVWVKEYNWTDQLIYEWTNSTNTGISSLYSQGGEWKYRIGEGGSIDPSNGPGYFIIADNTLNDNQWYHLLITRDVDGGPGSGDQTGVVKFYVDGVLTGTVTETLNWEYPADGTIMFGRNSSRERTPKTGFEFEGEFGPIRIFQFELTQSEVEYEYDMFALRYKGSFSATPGGLSINSATGIIDVSASVSGTYVVLATWTEPTSGKTHTASSTVTIGDSDASFNYSLNTYCKSNDSVITPTITGDSGGVFSAPGGLTLNTSTGGITPSTSTPGTYTVTYTTAATCSRTSSVTITIGDSDASFNYSLNTYCQSDDSVITPNITGDSGGVFSASPEGLSFIPSTGVISPSGSDVNTYILKYTTSGVCSATSTATITINLRESSSFNYLQNIYCNGTLGTVTPTIETLDGTFSVSPPTGLVIELTTGIINPSLSSVGSYTIEYTISGICSETSSFILEINDFKEDPEFSYPATSYCVSDRSTALPTIETPGGTFSVSPPTGLDIDLTTGIINPSLSSVGSYTIEYTTAGDCQDTSSSTIEIKPEDNPSFSYNSNLFCTENSSTISPTIVTLGGTFTSSPTGLSINQITGFITPSFSDPGIYDITYTTSVTLGCASSTTISVTISSLVTDTFDYGYTPGIVFCRNDSDLTPSISGLVSGTFYSIPSGLDLNPTTGKIDFQSSTPETYTIFYEVPSLCGNSTTSSTIILSECSPFSPDDPDNLNTCDIDGDGVCCASETIYGSNCEDPCSYFFLDVRFNNIASEWNVLDCDGDGVINGDELADNTDPRNACSFKAESRSVDVTSIGVDCDGDGVISSKESTDNTNTLNSCSFNIDSITLAVTSREDCDGDGVINSKEATDNTDPLSGCSFIPSSVSSGTSLAWQALDCDGDGVLNGKEINDGTNVNDRCDYNYSSITIFPERGFDCDGDGISNWQEVVNSKTNPKDPCDFDLEFIDSPFSDQWGKLDCDGDNYINSVDKFPLNRLEWIDTDNDSIGNNQDLDDDNDGIEDTKEGLGDIDNDGIPNSQDKDSDGDGCFDASEAGYFDLDLDGILGSGTPVIDSNGKVSSSQGYLEIADNDSNGILDFLDAGSDTLEIIKEPNNTTRIIRESEIEISILVNSVDNVAYKWQVNKSLGSPSSTTGEWIEITDDNLYGGTRTNKLTISNPLFSMEGWSYRVITNSPSYLCQEEIISKPSELIITNLIIPNVFSPDGDGINDTWTIRGDLNENYPNNQIRIFNRWGVSVYETKGYQNDWNGSNYNSSGSTSSNLPVGTYFYLLDLNGDGSNVKKGYVYLTRMNNE
ncbi:BspA family leucine-rich repeat surface protein [Flavobacteriaceae bacterium]|nr:BspA family leucine-rich repeat surface protein [Flavobacteriaceae bacterium]